MKSPTALTIADINRMDRHAFVTTLGPIYEKSPWIAEAAFAQRPFRDLPHLMEVMKCIVEEAGPEARLTLLRAHPDLAARLSERATLTRESLHEQAQAGLLTLPESEAEELRQLNQAYREKFGFPFIICARLHQPGTILASLRQRVERNRETELQEACSQVQLIAELRLRQLCLPG